MSTESLSNYARRPTRPFARPRIGSVTLALIGALYLIAFTNRTFFTRAYSYFDNHLTLAAFSLGLACLFAAFTITISVKYVLKPVLVLLIVSAAAGSWFLDRFGTIIDVDMIRNAVQTTSSEAGHLITPAFLVHMSIFGLLPALLVCWVRVEHRPFFAKVGWNLAAIVPLLLLALACGVSSARSIASVTRLHRDLMLTLNPFVPVGSALLFAFASEADKNIVAQPLGTDAHVAGPMASGKPRVLVIVTGETARAENFSLGGYSRETNPQLAKQDIAYFSDTSSCGTATAVSVPCMFSNLTRRGYSHRAGLANENLLDVLGHAGVTTEWWDNNTGSKGVANRTTYRSFSTANDPRYCTDNECLDDAMVADLDGWLSKVKGDSVLVLHQLGSHGPTYYLRYPQAFARFTPECRTGELGSCSHEEVVNAYDNTILYTDHILASVIDKLKAHQDKVAPAMIYMSDHGESLGEHGLYLHGAPYIVAPSQQTHIPFVLWQGSEIKASIDPDCLSKRTEEAASHDDLFHTTLGMMAVQTSVYKPELDVLGSCRKPTGASS
ncbi:lipid A ethanolaminephosphotransferase [Rhizobium sp. NFR07]|uniref:phosphoethanolamine transferase n=1 Tax=Rhizobium sp. NFR07 TaxID=1566262 RepID=UPI0008E6F122|nr:phosphoethanolamine--lipid A transferase [Rhizobium sp. NFR07]SFB54063.1 lipid A ethanolaminephosphotransferase [Rhizobium sp. NFR07]